MYPVWAHPAVAVSAVIIDQALLNVDAPEQSDGYWVLMIAVLPTVFGATVP